MIDTSSTKTARDFDPLVSRGLPSRMLISGIDQITPSDWLAEAIDEIESFAALPFNWDSYDASALRPDLLEGAKSLIRSIAASGIATKPYIYPTRNGGVEFEWENDSRYFEIEIVGMLAATYHYSDAATRIMESGEIFEGERLEDMLAFIRDVEKAPA